MSSPVTSGLDAIFGCIIFAVSMWFVIVKLTDSVGASWIHKKFRNLQEGVLYVLAAVLKGDCSAYHISFLTVGLSLPDSTRKDQKSANKNVCPVVRLDDVLI